MGGERGVDRGGRRGGRVSVGGGIEEGWVR